MVQMSLQNWRTLWLIVVETIPSELRNISIALGLQTMRKPCRSLGSVYTTKRRCLWKELLSAEICAA